MSGISIRAATADDSESVHAIYTHSVEHGTGTFAEEPPTKEYVIEQIQSIHKAGWPYLVAVDDSNSEVVGFAYAAQFRPRSAYRYCCEDSIYVSEAARGKRVGAALLQQLIQAAKISGFTTMLGVIGDSENKQSINLHLRHGFRRVGTMEKVGMKFGRWLDVVIVQLDLTQENVV